MVTNTIIGKKVATPRTLSIDPGQTSPLPHQERKASETKKEEAHPSIVSRIFGK